MLTFLAAIGAPEVALIIVVIILFFGAAKIPDIARALGRAKGEFEKGSRENAQPPREATMEDAERERVLKAARELGIPTDGRSLSDIKADVRAKMS
ncbi:MAG TPA: twin-arginine translocase TatA/TatE family subunit [Candidatus Thermoplasmatota archaeon]|nr:twin-arginine translocase TatA/TatE family subunit [Candidatus Thermoplasmatota archaeon]